MTPSRFSKVGERAFVATVLMVRNNQPDNCAPLSWVAGCTG